MSDERVTDGLSRELTPMEMAGQCWTDDDTRGIEMDSRLAHSFAERYGVLQAQLFRLRERVAELERERDEGSGSGVKGSYLDADRRAGFLASRIGDELAPEVERLRAERAALSSQLAAAREALAAWGSSGDHFTAFKAMRAALDG